MPGNEKACSICGDTKPLGAYNRRATSPDGRGPHCKDCTAVSRRVGTEVKLCDFCELPLWVRRRNFHPECAEPAKVRTEKRCVSCAETKAVSAFYRAAGTSDGWARSCRPCQSEKAMAWTDANADRVLSAHLVRKFGITIDEFRAMEQSQGGLCAICRQPPTAGMGSEHRRQGRAVRPRLVVDHNHDTGQVRGLLCTPCNRGIGFLADSAKRVAAALVYLEEADSNARQ